MGQGVQQQVAERQDDALCDLGNGKCLCAMTKSKHHRDTFIQILDKGVMKSGETISLQLVQTKLILALFALSQGRGQYNQAWDLFGWACEPVSA